MSHRLDEAVAKIKRAKQQLRTLDTAVERGRTAKLYGVRAELDADSGEVSAVCYLRQDAALRWGIATGEMIHHARGALEYAVWQGVKATGATPDEGVTGFPVFTDQDEFDKGRKRPGGRGMSGKRMIQGASPLVEQTIRDAQPFGPNFQQDPLWLLNELWKRDKHRALNVVTAIFDNVAVSRVRQHRETRIHTLLEFASFHGRIRVGDDLGKHQFARGPQSRGDEHFDVKLNAEYTPLIAFGEPGPWELKPLVPTLARLVDHAESIIDSLQPHI